MISLVDGRRATDAQVFFYFAYPAGVATDNSGNSYVADLFNARVRKIHRLALLRRLPELDLIGPQPY